MTRRHSRTGRALEAWSRSPAKQPGPVRAGPFDPDPIDHPELARPLQQLREPGPRGRDLDRAQHPIEVVEGDHDVDVGMGVDPGSDQTLVVWHRVHVRLLACWRGTTRLRTGLPRDWRSSSLASHEAGFDVPHGRPGPERLSAKAPRPITAGVTPDPDHPRASRLRTPTHAAWRSRLRVLENEVGHLS